MPKYSRNRSKTRKGSKARDAPSDAPPLAKPTDSNDDQETGKDKDSNPPRRKKKIFIPKSQMKKLLDTRGRQIWEKLKKVARDYLGTIWNDPSGDFRIDAGSTTQGRPNVKTWNLQVNKDPASPEAKSLKSKYGTHKKLFWDEFDLISPPDYETWVQSILSRFE